MTQYHGGKFKIGKDIAKIIYDTCKDKKYNGYCEPFCGMLSVYKNIHNLFESGSQVSFEYKAGDFNHCLIKMWKKAQTGWKPSTKKISKEKFLSLKHNDKVTAYKGFVGFVWDFRGHFFTSFAHTKYKTVHNSSIRVNEIGIQLKNVDFQVGDYTNYSNLKNFIIYCDPPYKNTASRFYNGIDRKMAKFDSEQFWEWCIEMSKHNIVFVSEYSIPDKYKDKCDIIYEKKNEKLIQMRTTPIINADSLES